MSILKTFSILGLSSMLNRAKIFHLSNEFVEETEHENGLGQSLTEITIITRHQKVTRCCVLWTLLRGAADASQSQHLISYEIIK